MTREEFNALIETTKSPKKPNDAEWEIINTVYTFHPSIDNVAGKSQIASLYKVFGMRVIRDMLPTAKKAAELESDILAAKHRLEELKAEYAELAK